MSQNPNYNPYEPNQPNPNNPAQPNYPPASNPGYGQNAPPPPPFAPDPESTPYGPYDQTILSQRSGQGYPTYPTPANPGTAYPTYPTPTNPANPGTAYPAYPAYPMPGNSGQTYPTPGSGLDFQTPATLPPMLPMPPAPPARKSNVRLILISVIALLLVVGSVLGFVLYNNHETVLHNDATSTAQAALHSTGTSQAYASATVNAQATATYVKTHYPFSSNLVLDDALKDNSGSAKYGWALNSQCSFTGGAYQVVSPPSFIQLCTGQSTNFSDFTFEVQMTIKSGPAAAAGGVFFRANADTGLIYILFVGSNGSYELDVRTGNSAGSSHTLRSGQIANFATGFFQVHMIGVVANGPVLSVYVDQQQVSQVNDPTYTSGQIGVIANYNGGSATVAYTNAKVWKL
ncbi:MAG TPA: hypothetical protein VGD98_24750 [Ktedonobacteraceae bacterium]